MESNNVQSAIRLLDRHADLMAWGSQFQTQLLAYRALLSTNGLELIAGSTFVCKYGLLHSQSKQGGTNSVALMFACESMVSQQLI